MSAGEVLYIATGAVGEALIFANTDWSDWTTRIASGATMLGLAIVGVYGAFLREREKYKREELALKRDEDALYDGSYRKKLDDMAKDLAASKADRVRLEEQATIDRNRSDAEALELRIRVGVLESEKQSWTLDQVTARRTTITNTQAPVSGESPAIVPPPSPPSVNGV